MIYSRIRGGLGNQLFQYCMARSLADKLNTSLGLDIRDFNANSPYSMALKNFNIRADFNPPGMIKHKKNGYIKYLSDIMDKNKLNSLKTIVKIGKQPLSGFFLF